MSENGSNNAREIWALDENIDERICDVEACHVRAMDTPKDLSYLLALRLAFQSLGVIYGDLSTSPLYVFNTIFPENIPDQEEVMGALSLIIYSLTLFPLIKYVFVVIRANDHGEGGTFAIYSLLCRHVKVNDIPNQHPTDKKLTAYRRNSFKDKSVPARIKKILEDNVYCQKALLIVVLIGTCMIIGDGVFTPSVSVLSSIVGISTDHREMNTGIIVIVATAILVILFSLQHYGTNKVGWLFAPAVLLWLLSIGAVGAYNVFHYDLGVLKAFSPLYVYRYLKNDSRHSWLTLGGIMICITGSENIFADLGHFSTLSVQIAFPAVVFPCLLLQYMGQAAYIIKHPFVVEDAFYSSIPAEVYWPIFCIATLASVIASQASITATFSIIKQSVALGCFPRVKVLHTSNDISGQIYIPEINWILMVLCVIVVAGFQDTTRIANAYGFSVIVVMLVTTLLMALVMLIVWRKHWFFVLLFISFFLPIELLYFSSALFKIVQGAWVPLVFAAVFLTVMYVWHYGTVKKYEFEISSKVSVAWLVGLGPSLGLVRVPGVGLVYTELVKGVPHIFSHLVTHLPAIHSVVVFACIKFLPVHRVSEEERFLVKRIGPKEFGMFRCVARYGYKDLHKKDDSFERDLFEALSSFVRNASLMENFSDSEQYSYCEELEEELDQALGNANTVSSDIASATMSQNSTASAKPYPQTNRPIGFLLPRHETVDDEIQQLKRCWDAGVVHVLGNTQIMARKESNVIKKIAIDYIYAFLRRICRENSVIFNIPQESLLNVGQICCV